VTALDCTVHVVDDDSSWRKSVQRLLMAAGYRVSLYESAEAFLKQEALGDIGCVLLDMRMPGLTGLQLQQRLSHLGHMLPVIFISGHGDIPTSVLAMKAGAEDFLTKPVDTDVLLDAISQAIARDGAAHERRMQSEKLRARFETLTPTERKVVDKVVRGRLNKQTALEMDIAERTVKWHRHNIMQKLHIESLAELVSLAERIGLLDDMNRRNQEAG
jgi:FixJ family two-component response regulator